MNRKPLRRKAYVVALDVAGEIVEHEIEVAPADMLRAETTAQKHGLPADPKTAPMSYHVLWLYLALVRLGLYEAGWQQFSQTDLYEWDQVNDDVDGEAQEPPVDPTTADTSASASSSPATSGEAPATGSTPTSTNAS